MKPTYTSGMEGKRLTKRFQPVKVKQSLVRRNNKVGSQDFPVIIISKSVQFICSRYNNAEVKSSTANTPEQLLILRFRYGENFPIRGNDTSRNQGIDFQAEDTSITTNTATKCYTNKARAGDGSAFYFMSVPEFMRE